MKVDLEHIDVELDCLSHSEHSVFGEFSRIAAVSGKLYSIHKDSLK